MASFRDAAEHLRIAAAELGIRVSANCLNDASAVACFGERFPGLFAAEGTCRLPAIPTVPPRVTEAARDYRIDPERRH